MEFLKLIKEYNLDGDQLQIGLNHLGFKISSFQDIQQDQLDELVDIFIKVADFDFSISNQVTKFKIKEFKGKLEKVLKGQKIKVKKTSETIKEIDNNVIDSKKINFNQELISPDKIIKKTINLNLTLGKVKYFNPNDNFRFIQSLKYNIDFYANLSNITTKNIEINDVVIFETVVSKKKPGELDAIKVSNNIPVFIFNLETKFYVFPLIVDFLDNKILLIEKNNFGFATGFATINANIQNQKWFAVENPYEIIPKSIEEFFAKKILAKLLPNFNEYKSAIEWLSTFLQNALNETEFNSIYSEIINNFEQKTIPEIYKEIENFMSISFFQSFFEEKKKSLNKTSFVLWLQGECDKLPHPSKKEEIDIWNVEILPSLERDTLQQVLTKLLSEQGATKQVEESYNYLISQGLQINTREELETVPVFLEAFIDTFPSIKITEANFSCNNTQFYIELFDRGILKTLSDDLILLYFNELKSDNEKNIFINTLFLKQGASIQIETLYKYLISKGWQITNYKELEAIAFFLEKFIIAFPAIEIIEANFSCTTTQYYIELFNKGILKELSETRTKQYIEELKTDDEKAGFIEKLPSDKILSYYFSFPSLSNYQQKYIACILESEFSKIDFLCFDIESDGEKINEFAWKSGLGAKSEVDFKKLEDGISELVNLINSGALIIGQNIKEFDLPILAKHAASPSSDLVWDTLEVEMLLNAQHFSYGLITPHGAKSDTELTYRLFKNQLSRIIVSQSNLAAVKELLPSKAIEAINQISNNSNWAMLDYEYFVKQSEEFFRPNPTNQNISEQTFNQLAEKLNEEGNIVVIAPEFLWNTLSHQFDLTFYSDNKSLGFCLNKEKIEVTLGANKLLKAILFRFVDSCISKGLQPYFQHLPIAIRLKLNSEQSTLICDNIDVDFGNINQKPICIKPTDLEILKQHCNQVSDLKVIVLGNELYNLTSKLQLGQDLDFATIFDRLNEEVKLLQLSGNKFIGLEKRHCELLGITDFPEFVQNIWLEKIGKSKFKVWCNLNFETCINDFSSSEVYYIDWVDETFTKANSFIIRPDARKSGYIAEQKRVNPESLYRKIYWVYQFKLFEGIGNTNNPKVLIVNDELEIEKLSAYARKKGYFIPDIRASLTRQMELLHAHKSPKLIITTFSNLDRVISSNYSGSLDYIWDSFLLQEKVQMLKGKIDKKDIEITENDKFIPFLKGDSTKKEDFDTYKLFKLHKPLVDYYYKMMIDNNHKSCLYLCDTRLADFVGIEQSLEVKAKYMSLWVNEEDFQADYKEASDFFPKDKIETNFDLDDAKKILSRLFLPKKENGEFNSWYDDQDNCLNDILPAEKDLLISLPTGAGKSVLFQAPALFRASFTNKLSIVITPLKALMHDQVEILQKIGLYSNVEYLSGDKPQEEIKDIYRRIVGGEITLLYITPERFRSRSFENCLYTRMDADNGLEYVVFDEAHCISQWGQEFRPDYLNAGRVISDKSKIFPMVKLLFSATISDQVLEEVQIIFHDKSNPKKEIELVKGLDKNYNPVRDHIKMEFKHNIIDEERLNEIAAYLDPKTFNSKLSRAIIFVKTRKKVEECTLLFPDTLKDVFGIECDYQEKVGSFHAGMDAEDRKDTYEKYKSGEIVILFATKAFGMGMDIPNIHFVTHFSPPSTFEDFLQEVGRAGRNKEKLLEAGFNNSENPIKALCLTSKDDFANLKQQLDKSRISWPEIKEIKTVLEKYIARFKPLIPNIDIPIAVPFNLYSNDKKQTDIDINDTKFRIALHWLEKLGRIKLGYFTITHLEFDAASLKNLANRIDKCPNEICKKVCNAIIQLMAHIDLTNEVIQLSIASLRSITKLSIENLFKALQKNHNVGILKLLQEIVIEPTEIRREEINYNKNKPDNKDQYPALKVIFSFAREILDAVPLNDSKPFDGEYLDYVLKELINKDITFKKLPWSKETNPQKQSKEQEKYINDIFKKRGKHAFTIIRKLGKTKHESKLDLDKTKALQIVSNGYHKKEEWNIKISTLEKDCIKLLDYIARESEKKNKFNWLDIINTLKIEGGIQYLSDLIFILSVLGYIKTRGGLLPSGIEIYLSSTEDIDETVTDSNDSKIYNEFTETQEVRELKLMSLQVLANLESDEQDAFIKGFFAAKSKKELINHLEGKIDSEHPIFKAFRGDAIKFQENHRLNDEQRAIYLSDPNQHINVMAGPGSGKTHTLTLRVAKLIYYNHAKPEEILVLAYNRAVVSELKERLGNLFRELGYGNLAKRIKIFTFHGLAKKYCQEYLEGLKFEEWEPKLLELLNDTPEIIRKQIAPLKHILVDEFQDIDEVRMDLLNKLNELTNAYLFIIGDPNQSIYGYARKVMNPYYYYNDFDKRFTPKKFTLLNNHRSYPEILNLASQILTLPEKHQHLIPRPTKVRDENFIPNYAQIIDRTQQRVEWWNEIENLCKEKVKRENDIEARPYKQIAVLFRTNNEVYRGFQRIKELGLTNIRIRIQGSLPYEFTRIRECHEVLLFLKSKAGQIPSDFKQTFRVFINNLINQNENWNPFYIRVIHALVLEYLEEQDESQVFDSLLEFITELTYKDDGQLYKIYEKHQNEVGDNTRETEIVLTTMHKVKGLEFDCVIVPPSFSNLPLKINDLLTQTELEEQLDEEKRLAFVAYSRAKYRLLIFKHFREIALANNNKFEVSEKMAKDIRYSVKSELSKLFISWAATQDKFSTDLMNYIKYKIKVGDSINLFKKFILHNDKTVGLLSKDGFEKKPDVDKLKDFIVNEIVVWSFEDTLKSDKTKPKDFDNWEHWKKIGKPDENGFYSNYYKHWCQEAINQGYIYLVDFAGFGMPNE